MIWAQRFVYWQIVPVGGLTVFLSALLLAVMIAPLPPLGPDAPVGLMAELRFAMSFAVFAVVIMAVPAMIYFRIWTIFLGHLRERLGFLRAAVTLSVGMSYLAALGLGYAFFRGDMSAPRLGVTMGLWPIGTALIAGGLTHLTFKNVVEEDPEC